MNTFGLLVLSICVISVDCSHFRGASFSWAPLSNGSIQVDYRVSWRRSYGGHNCNDSTIASRLLNGQGNLCPSYDPLNCHSLYYYCTDYSEEDDWTSGRYTLFIDPIGQNFTLKFESGDWVGYGGWSLLTTVDLTPRDASGWINSSPTVDYPPVVNLLHGCNHTISFPIRDVDGDIVRCRWATGSIECGSVCHEPNNLLPGAQLNQGDCTITYEATNSIGLYPLAIQVEDFANSSSSVPLSSIPLQFIVNIYNITNASCATELRFVTPTPASGDCFVLNVGEDFTVNITVIGTSSLNSLVTTSAVGMQRSAVISWQKGVLYYMSVTVHWTPTSIDDGQDHVLCFYARDINGRYSETRCITIPVGVSPPIPTRVERIGTTNAWNIEFNRQFSLPANYVNLTVVKTQTGEPAFNLNTSDTAYVSFYPTDKRIQVILDFDFEPPRYHVIIPEGIVRREGNCAILSPEVSSSSFWTFEIDCYLGFFRTINDICLECEEFQYGFNCSSDCTCDRTNSVSCNKVNGMCECHEGWTGDNCTVNINECESSDICSNKSNSNCVDMMGTYDCRCNVGYVSEGDECLDEDECKQEEDVCATEANTTCFNTEGGYECQCISGFNRRTNVGSCLKECDQVETIENGKIVSSDLLTITFDCDSGYLLAGEKMIQCLDDGAWNNSPPSCLRKVDIGSHCDTSDICRSDGARCIDSTCSCRTGMYNSNADICDKMELYPFGQDSGDHVVENNDDKCVSLVQFRPGIPIFDDEHKNVYVCSNGVVSVGTPYLNAVPPRAISDYKDAVILAPFFADSNGGNINYRTYDIQNNPDKLKQIEVKHVESFISNMTSTVFNTTFILFTTWNQVRPAQDIFQQTSETTFQLVLATDSSNTYVLYIYGHGMMNWSYLSKTVAGPDIWIGYTVNQMYNFSNIYSFKSDVIKMDILSTTKGISGVLLKRLTHATPSLPSNAAKCLKWYNQNKHLKLTVQNVSDEMPLCPCDVVGLKNNPWFNIEDMSSSENICAEMLGPTHQHFGKTCCYGAQGQILTDYNSTGKLLLYRPEYAEQHLVNDIEAFNSCCSSDETCSLFYELHPTGDCYGSAPFDVGALFGDPHFITLDGMNFTFNGFGEYSLLNLNYTDKVSGKHVEFKLQARTNRAVKENGSSSYATRFVAFAARDHTNASFQIELNNAEDGYTIYANGADLSLQYRNRSQSSLRKFKYISKDRNIELFKHKNKNMLVVLFPFSDISLNITIGVKMLSLSLVVDEKYKHITTGMLGNFDGNPNNDFITPDGHILLHDMTEEEIFDYGQLWGTQPSNSVFDYPMGKNHTDYNFREYRPQFLTNANPAVVTEAYSKCDGLGNTQCVFDYVFTEDINVALDTQKVERIVEDTRLTNNQTVPKVGVCDMVFVNIGEDAVCKLNISDTTPVVVNVSRTSSNGRVIYDDNFEQVTFSVDDDGPEVILVSVANDFNRRTQAHISVAVCTGCSQHGECIHTIRDDERQTNSFKYQTCVCQPQYEGVDCENVFDGCRRNPCSHLRKCTTLTAEQQIAMNVSYVCESCPEGYNSFDDKCKDIDECMNGDNTCEQTCLNNPGSYECSCTSGYRKSLSNDSICLDINECDEELHNCNHVCANFDGGYNCSCLDRYVLDNTTGQCILDGDVDNVCEQSDLNCSDTSGCTFDDDDSATCFCETGLALSDNGTSCIDVDECEQNICSQNCINTPGSFYCECYVGYEFVQGECKECEFPFWGPNCQNKCSCSLTTTIECHPVFGCQCSPGWEGMSCDQDIDECDEFPCSSILQKCLNLPGDYGCDCIDGYEYNEDEKICKDIDECLRPDLNKCSQTCTNVNGGYFCGCVDGYELYNDHLCRDIDDCEFGTNECEQLCVSGDFISGSYNCYCYYGYFINDDRRTCTKDPKVRDACEEIGFNCTHYCKPEVNPKNSKCRCRQGYKLANDQQTCIDINECLDSSLNKCDQKAECSNTEGSYECTCPIGSVLMNRRRCQECDDYHYGINCEKECNCVYGTCNPITGCQCANGWGGDDCSIDNDECAKNPCQNVANMECRNTPGSFSCECRTGYFFNDSSETCSDIDECLDNSPPRCDQKCINTPGSFNCKCELGFKYTNGRCEDLDECSGISKCDHICTNTIGSYRCSCQQGYKLNTINRQSCNPITTCSANETMDCEQKNASCAVVDGNSKCICKVGYEQETDSDMCIDIKECSLTPKLCQDHECVELEGSFECQCLPGFYLLEDGVSCQECNQGTYGANCNETCTCMTESTYFCDTTNGTCYCKNGWTGDNCEEDILECDKDDDLCDSYSVCVDIPGTFVCNCNQGYFKTGTGQCEVCNAFYFGEDCSTECSCDQENTEMCNNVNGECTCSKGWSGANCTDNIDECVNTTICLHKAHSSCIDTNGSYVCTCNDGYQPQGNRCLEIDECFEGTVDCTQECVNVPGSYMCQCFTGFKGNWNDCEVCNDNTFGFNCSKTCPCNITNSEDPNQTCTPTNGTCVCQDNWKGIRCNEDVNECANNMDNCHESNNTGCLNTVGGYLCVCLKGFVRNITTGQCESEISEDVTLPNGWVAVSYSISINVSLPPNFDLTLAQSYDIVEQNVITALENFIGGYTDGVFEIIITEIRYGSIEVDYLVSYDSKNSDIGDQLAYAAVDLAAGKDIVYDGQTVSVRSTEFNNGTDPCVIYTSVIGCFPPNVCVVIDELPVCRYEIKAGNYGLIIYLSVFLSLAIILVVLLVLCCLLLRKEMARKKLLKQELMTKQKITLPGVPENVSRLIYDGRKWKAVTDLDDAQTTTKFVDNKHSKYNVDLKTHKTSKSKLQQRYDVLAVKKMLRPMVIDDDQRRDYMKPGDGDNHRGHREQRQGNHRRSYSQPALGEQIRIHREQDQQDYRRLPSALQRDIQTYEYGQSRRGQTGSFHEAEDAMRQQGQHLFDQEDVQLRRESPQRSLLRRSFSYHERIVEPERRNEPGRHSYHVRDWY